MSLNSGRPCEVRTYNTSHVEARKGCEFACSGRRDGAGTGADLARRPAADRRIRKLSLDDSPSGRPEAHCEVQLSASAPHGLQSDRTPDLSALSFPRRGGEVQVIMASDLANPCLVGEPPTGLRDDLAAMGWV